MVIIEIPENVIIGTIEPIIRDTAIGTPKNIATKKDPKITKVIILL